MCVQITTIPTVIHPDYKTAGSVRRTDTVFGLQKKSDRLLRSRGLWIDGVVSVISALLFNIILTITRSYAAPTAKN